MLYELRNRFTYHTLGPMVLSGISSRPMYSRDAARYRFQASQICLTYRFTQVIINYLLSKLSTHFRERTALETCFDDVREQCESGYISNRVDNLNMALKGCDFMGRSI